MIRFLFKGILRDPSRSWLPIVIVTIGSMLTVALSGYLKGAMGDVVDQNARFDTGHVKIMTRAYAEDQSQLPNDLALLDIDQLIDSLNESFSELTWVPRIKFGGLVDVADSTGNTIKQGPSTVMAIDLFNEERGEVKRWNLNDALVEGRLPQEPGEVLIGDLFAKKLGIGPGDEFTFMGSTMYGSMTFRNFDVCGTVRFGTGVLDRGAVVMDLGDAQVMMDMDNAAGELLGYLKGGVYFDSQAEKIANRFNAGYASSEDEFDPVMLTLKQQNNLASLLDYAEVFSGLLVILFVVAMSVVLWNTGLLGGLRRYREFGIRLALGESKGEIYRSLIVEAILIGFIGSVLGTAVGLFLSWLMQVYGIDIGEYMDQSTILMPTVIRSKITSELFYIGFIPGLFAMVLGNMLAGYGIYRRETARLFKELEV